MGVRALFAIRDFPAEGLAREDGDPADNDEYEPEESVKEQRSGEQLIVGCVGHHPSAHGANQRRGKHRKKP